MAKPKKIGKKWKRRNKFGFEYRVKGHDGRNFNLENKETLLENPEYLATKTGKFNRNAKLNVGQPEAVKLFVEYYLNKAQTETEVKKYPGIATVSVESSDGGGYCQNQ